MLEILKDDAERWFIARQTTIGALFGITPNISRVKCFGNVPDESRLSTGQPVLEKFMTEEELQIRINQMAGDPNYYKNAVTTGNPIYNGVSGIYGPYYPPAPDPPELDVEQP